jgi:hypothetical protein
MTIDASPAASVVIVLMFAVVTPTNISAQQTVTTIDSTPPVMLLGDFIDDYDGRFSISATEFVQRPRNRYLITAWRPSKQYLIALNAESNPSASGKWTRIDWVRLDSMPPWEWAFCFTIYDAPSAEAAEATVAADRGNPRVGCNGHPFSRMKRVSSQ